MIEHPLNLIRLRPRWDTEHVSQGHTVLATRPDGFLPGEGPYGLFVYETRMLSRYRYLIDGRPPLPVALSNIQQHSWLGYYIIVPPGVETGVPDIGSGMVNEASQHTLEVRTTRYAGQGLHEDIDLTNYSREPTTFHFEIELDADFADLVEARGERRQHGDLTREWHAEQGELVFDYRAEHAYDHQGNAGTAHLHRRITIRVENADSPPSFEERSIRFHIHLEPGEEWHTCLSFIPWIDGRELTPIYSCGGTHQDRVEQDRRRELFLKHATRFTSPRSYTLTSVVVGAMEQAKRDLAALRLYNYDHGERSWTMAAGLPLYLALFGRDTLIASWQAAMASTDMMPGTLLELAEWQGDELNNWRDEQPGRMVHEVHTGPLEVLNYNPRRCYYGSVNASTLYPVVVSELWRWTGNEELIRPAIEPMLRALRWLDVYGDLDEDGFYEYKTRSTQGITHQAWKDSQDAIIYPDGMPVEPPIATCEEQGFAYLAKLRASEVLWWLGEREDAQRLYREAEELKARFNETFWMEDEGFFAMGLDSRNRPIRTIGSNPGHCLATTIAADEYVRPTAERMFADDMFSGWGIRTLSSNNPAYNPYSYHRGSVWPMEQGFFVLAFVRHGLHDLAERLSHAQLDAVGLFEFFRLPEVFGGHPRDMDHPFPGIYPQTNIPQAWSASTILLMVQSLLGLYPYAPLDLLLVDPHLPDWLPELTLHGMRVGDATTTLHFYRREDGSSAVEVQEVQGSLQVVRQPNPWSLRVGPTGQLVEKLKGFV